MLGLVNGRLRACPYTPNCVCTESGSDATSPLPFSTSSEAAWQDAQAAIDTCGGKAQTVDHTYLHATFVSRVFGFVDDLELRLDTGAGVIHVRSASRLGRFDLGVNRKRVERLRSTLRVGQQFGRS